MELITPIVPITIEAWEDYSPYRKGILLSSIEINALKKIIKNNSLFEDIETDSKSEKIEWKEKFKRLGLLSD